MKNENPISIKLRLVYMTLFRLSKDGFVDDLTLTNSKELIDDFLRFLGRRNEKYAQVPEIIELLEPAQKTLELHLKNEIPMRAMVELALWDFEKAMDKTGKYINGEDYSFHK